MSFREVRKPHTPHMPIALLATHRLDVGKALVVHLVGRPIAIVVLVGLASPVDVPSAVGHKDVRPAPDVM